MPQVHFYSSIGISTAFFQPAVQKLPNEAARIRGIDTQARALVPAMEEFLGGPIRIINKTGAGGTVGLSSLLLPAKADGYTIAAAASVSLIENPILQELSYGVDDVTVVGTTGSF